MGTLALRDALEHTKQEQTLIWHLRSNHYPPIDLDFLPVAKTAIEEGNKENWEKIIKMPNGHIKKVGNLTNKNNYA